jgi:hypothetical protein
MSEFRNNQELPANPISAFSGATADSPHESLDSLALVI